jgi:hypothetical protein
MNLKGGPYAGQKHTGLNTLSTLEFHASGQCGRYSADGTWTPAALQGPELARSLGYRVEEPTVLNGGDRTTTGAIGQP